MMYCCDKLQCSLLPFYLLYTSTCTTLVYTEENAGA